MSKSIETRIKINASTEKIWNVLMDFESYPTWNPFIQSITGKRAKGEKLVAKIGGEKGMVFKPTVTDFEKNQHFAWLGSLWTKGIFDGKHEFILKSINQNTTELIHKENFKGLLSGLIFRMVKDDTKKGFNAMNHALKTRAELRMS